MTKSKTVSVRLSPEQDEIIKSLSKSLRISKAEAIRQFIDKNKIIVVEGFAELLPMLAVLTSNVQRGNASHEDNIILREAVDKLWKSLKLSIKDQ
ncbi:MAG: ribbon-helix-helix protein, CopG family [Eubacterium sp.]|nr:ribbon-helix-helix protein, CopG family [Clostridia bacterium]MCI8956713.1 ribbon-helix-helix protein, CopG family [Eubacterium sp.]